MVGNVTSLTNNGLKDWLIQRLTAGLLLAYVLCLLTFVVGHPGLTYEQWHQFFGCRAMKVFTSIAAFAYLLHAWIGLWMVATDYIKANWLRLLWQASVILILFASFIWVLAIVWSV